MLKFLKYVGQGIKYTLYLGGVITASSLTYLQYINYKIGSIDIDREAIVKYYGGDSGQYKMSE